MAGHSKFKNIMHRKGRQDAIRSKMFSRLSKEITVAVKMGGGVTDPDMNPRLRLAIQNAKGQSMPKDNIQRAINKGSGADSENYEEIRYEGYGPGGVAIVVEALTDNKNRSASNIRACFTKNGGQMAETGSVSFMFDRVGEIVYKPEAGDEDTVMEAAIEAGADDVASDEDGHTIICSFDAFGEVTKNTGRCAWVRRKVLRLSGSLKTIHRLMKKKVRRFLNFSMLLKKMMTFRTFSLILISMMMSWQSFLLNAKRCPVLASWLKLPQES